MAAGALPRRGHQAELLEQAQRIHCAPVFYDLTLCDAADACSVKQARSSRYRRGCRRSPGQANGGQDSDANYTYGQDVYQGNAWGWWAAGSRHKRDHHPSQAGAERRTEDGGEFHRGSGCALLFGGGRFQHDEADGRVG